MIVGTGIDIVDIERVRKAVDGTAFSKRVFSASERKYCESRQSQRYASYAARFAGKEAFVKALGTGFRCGNFTDISIENDDLGCPRVLLYGYYLAIIRDRKIDKIHISLSHSKEWAVAEVILEGDI